MAIKNHRGGMVLVASLFALISPMTNAISSPGYSASQNQRIWQVRLDAQKFASLAAAKECSWSPGSPETYSDQPEQAGKVADVDLLRRIMSSLRIDQNARAIATAFDDATANEKVNEVDASNLSVLKSIISKHGFPTTDAVGEQGVNAMLLLLAHADQDVAFQRSAASIMQQEVARGALPAVYLLVLTAIRPNIFQQTVNLNQSPKAKKGGASQGMSGLDESKSSRTCYNNAYQKSLNSYIKSNFMRDDVMRKLPRQADTSKVEPLAICWRYSAGVRSPSDSWGRCSL